MFPSFCIALGLLRQEFVAHSPLYHYLLPLSMRPYSRDVCTHNSHVGTGRFGAALPIARARVGRLRSIDALLLYGRAHRTAPQRHTAFRCAPMTEEESALPTDTPKDFRRKMGNFSRACLGSNVNNEIYPQSATKMLSGRLIASGSLPQPNGTVKNE